LDRVLPLALEEDVILLEEELETAFALQVA
jgi:hypothetical protein